MTHVIAHRGLRNEKPENSIDAIDAALRLPAVQGVEFDVELTRDQQLVVLHQETLVPSPDGSRVELASRDFVSRDWVIETLAEDVVKMDAGSWMDAAFAHVKVPTLEDVLRLPWGQITAYVELKDATYWGRRDVSRPDQVVDAALPHLTTFPGSIHIISFNPEILRRLQAQAPTIATTLALWTEWRSRINEAVAEAKRCGASTISLPDLMILDDHDWIKVVHESGLKIHAYPVSPARGEPEFLAWTAKSQADTWRCLYQLGVDAILSDFARETTEALRSA
jgi:glycerophosphoryl diester phosphodiesterase